MGLVGRSLARRTGMLLFASILPGLPHLLRGLWADTRVPKSARWIAGLAALWIISPFDLVPDFIPVLGFLDDIVVATVAVRLVLRAAGPGVIRDHWNGNEQGLERLLRIAGFRVAAI